MELNEFITVFRHYRTAIRVGGSLNLIVFVKMSLVNLYYLVTRIMKLHHKSFHLQMIVLLQVCYTLLLVAGMFMWAANFEC